MKEELENIRDLISDNQRSVSSVVQYLSQIQEGIKKLNDDMHLWVTAQLSKGGGGTERVGSVSSRGSHGLTPTSEDVTMLSQRETREKTMKAKVKERERKLTLGPSGNAAAASSMGATTGQSPDYNSSAVADTKLDKQASVRRKESAADEDAKARSPLGKSLTSTS